MKNALLFLMLSAPVLAFCQKDTSTIDRYCIVGLSSPLFSSKVVIRVDYGQAHEPGDDMRLRDSAGEIIKLNSVADALNYMADQGWKLFSETVEASNGSTIGHNYLFKKEVPKKTK